MQYVQFMLEDDDGTVGDEKIKELVHYLLIGYWLMWMTNQLFITLWAKNIKLTEYHTLKVICIR